ncbi:ribonuclease HII [Sanguibacter sp. A247]|uniref:ribonuclease HII n=1 Tax=unclassified Sanguibacter TaxID=2645534 RepID=UPI003FD8DAC7
MRVPPDVATESAWLVEGVEVIAGMDEVGRGALAGPVTVGCAVVSVATLEVPFPQGLTDSKLLSAPARERIEPAVAGWVLAWGVGHASPAEIDAYGIIVALRTAGRRALRAAQVTGPAVRAVLLDGSHDWLSEPREDLFAMGALEPVAPEPDDGVEREVRTVVKGDLRCASISAASVLAKQSRDRLMAQAALRQPGYGWAQNKGYGSAAHLAEIRRVGPSDEHRRSWRLPEREAVLDAVGDGG